MLCVNIGLDFDGTNMPKADEEVTQNDQKTMRKMRWISFLALILFLFLLLEVLSVWVMPRQQQQKQQDPVTKQQVSKVVDCLSCRWLLSEMAFGQGDVDQSLAFLSNPKKISTWYMPFLIQRQQIAAYKNAQQERAEAERPWWSYLGVSVNQKKNGHFYKSEKFMRKQVVLMYYKQIDKEML